MKNARSLLAVAVPTIVVACATTHHVRPLVAPMPPLPRSSVAAVLLHRDELGLTDEQVQKLDEIEARRERLVGERYPPPAADGGTPEARPEGYGGGHRGGGHGGGWGGPRGGGMGGHGRHGGFSGSESEEDRNARVLKFWDDHDTSAYFEAEQVLTDAQRPRARELASKFRADLNAQREAYRKEHEHP